MGTIGNILNERRDSESTYHYNNNNVYVITVYDIFLLLHEKSFIIYALEIKALISLFILVI